MTTIEVPTTVPLKKIFQRLAVDSAETDFYVGISPKGCVMIGHVEHPGRIILITDQPDAPPEYTPDGRGVGSFAFSYDDDESSVSMMDRLAEELLNPESFIHVPDGPENLLGANDE